MSEESSDKMGQQWTDLRSKVRTWVRCGASGSCGRLSEPREFSGPSQPSHNPSGTELHNSPMDSEILHIIDSDYENTAEWDEREALAKAVASLNMARQQGKANISLLDMEEDEELTCDFLRFLEAKKRISGNI
ncbi:hypothetical protein B0H11DRAFT_1922049 [Mycena galericulata]|nr:hypothetical protein B0H11DRAFT_1922049 [Mycena galericulata]